METEPRNLSVTRKQNLAFMYHTTHKILFKLGPVFFPFLWKIKLKWVPFYQSRSQNCEKRLLASSCLCFSVRPHGTTRFPLNGFSLSLIFEYFSQTCRTGSSFITIWQEQGALDMATNIYFFIIFRSILRRMRNVLYKSCRENQNTHFTF
jgi:hypothetical protein